MFEQTVEQLRASDPKTSVWVGASAGTGKTFVLSNRVLRLMLDGSRPDKILCLTYTKTAAAEMAIRVNNRLSGWVRMEDKDLFSELESILGTAPDKDQISLARKLFAQVLDVPGGLKIQTIHSFCQSLLGRFPIEANIAPNFDLLDDITIHEQISLSQDEILLDISQGKKDDLKNALEHISSILAEETFSKLMKKLAYEKEELALLLKRNSNSFEDVISALREMLELNEDDTIEGVIEKASHNSSFDAKSLLKVAETLQVSNPKDPKVTDMDRGKMIFEWVNNDDTRIAGFAVYMSAFLTAEGNIRKTLMTKPVRDDNPEASNLLDLEAERIKQCADKIKALTIFENTQNVLRIGFELIKAYNKRKQNRNVMDFDDLIARVRNLLHDVSASWILFKLDGGIDHILIDEAQDTNPIQWDIIRKLSDEFFVGVGVRDEQTLFEKPRTIFAVGDIKQSIYSFQKAEPKKFDENKRYFIRAAAGAKLEFDEVPMNLSFRSTTTVLEMVDQVFNREEHRQSISLSIDEIRHTTHRRHQSGLVEVWPTVKKEKQENEDGWLPPIIQKPSQNPERIVAENIATQIEEWIEKGEILASKGRPVNAGDILILVRRRSGFVHYMMSELKKRNIKVAGLDRMDLTDELSIMDMMAIANFTLLPSDDLTLAVVLKSPFIGLSEEDLFDLAYGREKGKSLWSVLLKRKSERPSFEAAAEYLTKLSNYSDFHPPFEFFSYLLGPMRGREKLIARLGEQINDPVDEFLNQAMKYEKNNISSMQGFLRWIEKGEIQIKREMEQSEGMVRIMTVHAAKGLQAPIVFLPDTCNTPTMKEEALLWYEDKGKNEKTLILKQSKQELVGIAKDAFESREQELQDEYKRLLYVAMTRAEDRLYITGFEGQNKLPTDSWYNLVRNAILELPNTQEIETQNGIVLRSEHTYPNEISSKAKPAKKTSEINKLPAWALSLPPAEPTPTKPLTPSRPDEKETVTSPLYYKQSIERENKKYHRGRLIHKLLEILPDINTEARWKAAEQYLSQSAHGLSEKEVGQITNEVISVLEDERFAALFSKESRAEVPIVGQVGNYTLSGFVDRLVIEGRQILIVDYKTNRPPPENPDNTPKLYLRQMAAYRKILSDIYPEHAIRSMLLWTDNCLLMEIPDYLLDKIEF